VLHYIGLREQRGAGSYKEFVSNGVQKIQQHPEVKWRHVGTKDNPADLGSRSRSVENEMVAEARLHSRGPCSRSYQVQQQASERQMRGCVYCNNVGERLTMAKICEKYWVPRLRCLAKRVVKACDGCKRFQITAFAAPPPGQLLRDRTEGKNAFQVVGVDFAGPIKYRKGRKKEKLT